MTELPHGTDVTSEGDEDKRRRFLIWIILGVLLLILILLLSLCRGSDDDPVAVAPTAATTAAPSAEAPTATTIGAAAPAATTTTVAAPTATTPPDTTTTTRAPTIDGVWTMNVDVTVATGACGGEEDEDFTPDIVTIRQDGDTFTLLGLGFPPQEQLWQGRVDGNLVTFGGERTEDDGTTTASFTMEVDFENLTMTGKEDWTWEGPGGTCPNSESAVTAFRTGS